MSNVLDLIRQVVSGTPGTGAISLGLGATGYIGIQDHPDTVNGMTIDYSIVDGNNKEFGIGTYSTTGDVLTRTWIQGKLESGTFTKNPGTGLNLTSSAIVSCGPIASRHQFRGCLLTNSTGQNIPNTTDTELTWDTEIYDTNDFHSTLTNPERITIPNGVSKIRLISNIRYNATQGGYRQLFFYKNGVTADGSGRIVQEYTIASTNLAISLTTPVLDCIAGDYFSANTFHNQGGTLSLLASSSYYYFGCEVIE